MYLRFIVKTVRNNLLEVFRQGLRESFLSKLVPDVLYKMRSYVHFRFSQLLGEEVIVGNPYFQSLELLEDLNLWHRGLLSNAHHKLM